MGGAHDPTAGTGAGAAQRLLPQQQTQSAARLHRQIQAARGGQVGGVTSARQFPDHGGDTGATQTFLHRPQGVFCRRRPHQQQTCGIETEKRAARSVRLASFQSRHVLLDPGQRARTPKLRRQSQRETSGRAQMENSVRHDLVQVAHAQPQPRRSQRQPACGVVKKHLSFQLVDVQHRHLFPLCSIDSAIASQSQGKDSGYSTIEGVKSARQRVTTEAGIPVSTYSWRQKVTTVLRRARVPEDQIADMLGHRRPHLRTTAGYGDWDPNYQREAASALDAWFWRIRRMARKLATEETANSRGTPDQGGGRHLVAKLVFYFIEKPGAGEANRTPDPNLGKVMLYP